MATIKLKDILEGKYDPQKKSGMWFVRYGGLSSKKQRGYDPSDPEQSFHQPPARHGMYAFTWPFVDQFMLGGDPYIHPKLQKKNQTLRIQYVKDKEGNKITNTHPDFEKMYATGKYSAIAASFVDPNDPDVLVPQGAALIQHANRKKFQYDGDLWHHLGEWVDTNEIQDSRGTWVKSSTKAYRKALNRWLAADKRSKLTAGAGYVKDALEVFIERI